MTKTNIILSALLLFSVLISGCGECGNQGFPIRKFKDGDMVKTVLDGRTGQVLRTPNYTLDRDYLVKFKNDTRSNIQAISTGSELISGGNVTGNDLYVILSMKEFELEKISP